MTNQELDKMLDHVKKDVFLGKNAAFLGSVLCSQEFLWDRENDIVATNGVKIWWGVADFLRCVKSTRVSTLLHELWHVAKLHHIRRGNRDPAIWNVACDYRVNNDLRRDGYDIPDTWIVNPEIDKNGILAEEEIYDKLVQNLIRMPVNPQPDLREDPGVNPNNLIASVVRAVQAAEMAGQAGKLPGSIKEVLRTFLDPVVPWRVVLLQWMTELLDHDYTWKRPNRRYQDIYLPSSMLDEGRLEHLVYFQDTSGSITRPDMDRFNSEVKYVQEVLNPQKLTLVQFDTKITFVKEFTENDRFEEAELHGGGGTSLAPVKEWIEEHKPTAAIIFSDLECRPMEELSYDIPIIWAVIRNKNIQVPFGKLIHITE